MPVEEPVVVLAPVVVEEAPVVIEEEPKVTIDTAPLASSDFVTETVTPNVGDIITPAQAEDEPMQIDALILDAVAEQIQPAVE
jgi:hypothetical protein